MRKIHNIAVGLYALHRIFLKDFIPDSGQEISSTITAFVGLILIVAISISCSLTERQKELNLSTR